MAHTEKGKISWSFQRPQLLLKRDSQGTNLRAIETRSAGFEALPSGHKPETGGTGANGALTLSPHCTTSLTSHLTQEGTLRLHLRGYFSGPVQKEAKQIIFRSLKSIL